MKTLPLRLYSLFLSMILLTACAGVPESTEPSSSTEATVPTQAPTQTSTQPPETKPADPLEALLDRMTLREKVGQLFIVRPDALDPSLSAEQIDDSSAPGVTALSDAMVETLRQYPVGGIAHFAKNLVSPEQITRFNQELQEASGIPLFLCVDEEGGPVARLANHKAFDLPRYKNAAISSETEALDMGRTIGSYLAEYGFNLDFAPVADVNTNPANPVIGTRAFSSNPETAAALASAMAQGLREEGILAVFKHFPGHGDTAEDSHSGIAVTYKTQEEMDTCEWLPFRQAGSGDLIMVGHIAAPKITGDLTPATLSRQIVTGILRETLGFEGLIITDSLTMGAVIQRYSSAEAAVAALNAGCDLLLMPENLGEAFEAVMTAVEDGTYPEETLNETVLRILRFKQAQGLLSLS